MGACVTPLSRRHGPDTSYESGTYSPSCASTRRSTRAATRDNGLMVQMTREAFEEAVVDAIDTIPDDLAALMDNVVILVEDDPPDGERDLLGLYEGVALTERGDSWGMGELPDRIFIFRNPTLRMCRTADEVREEVAVTVVHEIAHHFGIDDDKLHELGWG